MTMVLDRLKTTQLKLLVTGGGNAIIAAVLLAVGYFGLDQGHLKLRELIFIGYLGLSAAVFVLGLLWGFFDDSSSGTRAPR